jgi:hypothetical protein
MRRSGRIFSPPILLTGSLIRPTVWTENPKVRRSSANADAGSQSAKPPKTNKNAVWLSMEIGWSRSKTLSYCLTRFDSVLTATGEVFSKATGIAGIAGNLLI